VHGTSWQVEKAEAEAESEESARLVNSLERQISAAEATEAGLQRKVEELQAEMDEEDEANEEEKRAHAHRTTNPRRADTWRWR
jgi:hypothetical protein